MTRPLAMLSLAAALAAGATACTPETVERQVMVQTRMSVDEFTCGPVGPDQLPLDCGGSIGFFAIDPYAPPGEEILASHCVDFAPSADDTLRMLATHLAAASFSFAEGTTIAMQVIVYPGSEEGCPPISYDSETGAWGETPGRQQPRYAGRSAAQTLQGDEVTFELPIGCPVFFFPECPSSTHKLQSYVRNLSTLRLLSSGEAQAFDVHAAQIFYPGGDPVAAALTPIADLTPQASSFDALFEVTSETGFGFTTDCIGTIVTRIPGPSVSTASCEGGVFSETQILAQSYYVEQPHIDDILAELGLASFPAGGVLVGRLTQNGSDVGDAIFTVRPQTGTAEVHYFDEDATGHLVERPSGGSWFVVTDAALLPYDQMGPARCCEYFEAVNERGDIFPSYARVGLINGVVTSTEIPTFVPGM